MEILTSKQHHQFLAFLPMIKFSLAEWQLVTVRMDSPPDDHFNMNKAAELIYNLFQEQEGRIFVCNDYELLMVVQEREDTNPVQMAKRIEEKIPKGRCEVQVEKPTTENMARFKIFMKFDEPQQLSEAALKRQARTENVILIADDDQYMRTLVKKGLNPQFTIHEVIHGSEIMAAYKKYVPDVLFLDIHMPGKDGLENLEAVLAFDPQAYVVMLSSDSSPENVLLTTKHGAKGFMAKPFTKDRLMDFIEKCPTIT